MKRLEPLEYLRLSRPRALLYRLSLWLESLPLALLGVFRAALRVVRGFGLWLVSEARDIYSTFKRGGLAVKLSFLIFGVGQLYYGQILRGLFFLLFEVAFAVYMLLPSGGIHWLSKCNWFETGATVGTEQGRFEWVEQFGDRFKIWVAGDDSVKVLLYGLLTVFFILAFIYTWRLQLRGCRICLDITDGGGRVRSGRDDLRSLLDDEFHKTLLALPVFGIAAFTVIPIIFMTLIAFTSYDAAHDGYSNLFSWMGLHHFNELLNFEKGGLGLAFGEILSWTLMWAILATFTNFFLGMLVAMLINKRGIKFKKFWRTALVMTIAIPQFVSLLYVAKLFDTSGIIGSALREWGLIPRFMLEESQYGLWQNPITARILVIAINVWVGIPYIMLIATGILMNIPKDLYESSRIDGAGGFQQYTRITLPYMMFVMGPYLLTSFVGNLNNFNVIYLLTENNRLLNTEVGTAGGVAVTYTDLLITWLYKMTLNSGESRYYYASIVGIVVFLVVAVLSLIIYNLTPSTRNEEDYR